MRLRAWLASATVLGTVSAALGGAIAANALTPEPPVRPDCPPTTAVGAVARPFEGATAKRIPERYAPIVFLHPKEQFYPMPVDCFIANSSLEFAQAESNSQVVELGDLTPANLLSADHTREGYGTRDLTRPYAAGRQPSLAGRRGFFLDLEDRFHRGAAPEDEVFFGGTPVYYDFEPGKHITYWLFFGFSAPGGRIAERIERAGVKQAGHEGDWEGISIALDDADRPVRVRYFAHGEKVEPLPWNVVKKLEGHPIVFTALGSHASYTRRGGQKHFDITAGGPIWATWLLLADVRRQPWYGYGGAWGRARPVPRELKRLSRADERLKVKDGDFTGPSGPPFKASPFDEPARATPPSPLQ